MTTAQHSSYMNANLPNLKAQSMETLGDSTQGAVLVASKDEREQFVPDAKDAPVSTPARSGMPASPTSSASDGAAGSPAGPAATREEQEKKLVAIEDVTVDASGDILVKVPADLVGRMIGKHGTVIKELQLQSGAFINMAKDGEVFRIARISGGYAESRLCACLLVEKFTPADNSEKRVKLEDLVAHYRLVANRPQRQYLVESFTLPADTLTRMLSRGGLLLREVQDKTRAKIDLPRSTGGDEVRKVVTISGTTAEVGACREYLRNLIQEPAPHASEEYYVQQAYEPTHAVPSRAAPYYPQPYPMAQYPMHYVPTAAAPAGYAEPYGGAPYAAVQYGGVPYGGAQYMMGYPAGYYPEPLTPDMARLSLEQDDHVVPRESLGMPVPMAHLAAPMLPIAETIVSIPGEMVGRLIGRQGVAVKQLQNETRTRIDILDPAQNQSNAVRFVRITGPKAENVQHCVQLIQSRVAAFWGNAPSSPASSHH